MYNINYHHINTFYYRIAKITVNNKNKKKTLQKVFNLITNQPAGMNKTKKHHHLQFLFKKPDLHSFTLVVPALKLERDG